MHVVYVHHSISHSAEQIAALIPAAIPDPTQHEDGRVGDFWAYSGVFPFLRIRPAVGTISEQQLRNTQQHKTRTIPCKC